MQSGEKGKKRITDETNNCCRSRGRGYLWESTLVKRFQSTKNWDARRLGGSSTGLPDIVATDRKTSKPIHLVTIEAKSGTRTVLEVREDQIKRCFTVCDFFSAYYYRWVVLAFKFSRKKRIRKEFETRDLREYFVLVSNRLPSLIEMNINHVWCNYEGEVRIRTDNDTILYDKYYYMFDSYGKLMEHLDGI